LFLSLAHFYGEQPAVSMSLSRSAILDALIANESRRTDQRDPTEETLDLPPTLAIDLRKLPAGVHAVNATTQYHSQENGGRSAAL